jgi:hypothetical protein
MVSDETYPRVRKVDPHQNGLHSRRGTNGW